MTSALVKDEQQIWINWTTSIQSTIFESSSLNSVQKFIKLSFSLKKFFKQYESIKLKLSYIRLGAPGNCNNLIAMGYEVLTNKSKNILVFDSSQSNPLFNAMKSNISNSDPKLTTAVQQLITNIQNIMSNSSLTYVRQQANIYSTIQKLFLYHPNWKSILLNFEISNYGKFEYFYDITSWVS